MSDQSTFSRRRMLALSATGLALSIAGCTGQSEQRSATVTLQPPQAELESAQTEARAIQRQQLNGSLTRAQAQQQISQLRSQLFDGLIQTATTEAESLGLTVEDSIQPTTLLVSGPESKIMDLLDVDIVSTISSPDTFEQQQQQQQQQQQSPSGNETSTENDTTN